MDALRGFNRKERGQHRMLSSFLIGWQVAAPGGGWRDHILGSQVSAIGYQVRVFRFRYRTRVVG